tara:strand:- start:69 stop:1769 length:1701 start_codon:yes stop_codon:yes gene_type:complete
MASIIRVKRSTGATAPTSLNFGELAITIGAGTQANKGERLFIGDDASPSNIDVIGGKYYTDLMAHAPGLVAGTTNPAAASNGFVAIVDQNRKVDQWNVDDLRLDGNTLSSQTTDADINIDPNGSGEIVIPDDTFLTFGDSKDAKIEYDENGTDKIQVSGADWVYGNTVALTIQDPTQSNNKDTGSIVTEGGLGVEKNVNIGGDLNVAGVGTFIGGIILPPDAALTVGNIGIHSNKIETLAGGGNQIFIDPFPSGTSNEGDVIIKGNLQVDGTTTAVNSTNVTVNDPIMRVGDVTSVRSVMATVSSGANTITVDSVVGLQVADVVAGTSIPNNTTISSINSGTKVITLSANVTAGIATTAQLTVTHAKDTNTDRGISFNYNTSTGVSNNKTGFFGYNDSTGENSSAPARAFTYIPDATVTNEVVTGIRGNLDIKGIYYQTGDFSTHGIVYFDSDGLQKSSDAPSAATFTSTQVLTAVTEVTIPLPSALSVTAGDRITQPSGGGSQQGVVKTTSNTTSITLIGVQGTFTNSADLFKNGTTTSITPSAAPTVVYTDKPVWTTTIDGGVF